MSNQLFLLLLISIFCTGTINTFKVIKNGVIGSSFLQDVTNLATENKQRYSSLYNVIKRLDMDSKKTNLKLQEDRIDLVLAESIEIYGKIIPLVTETCNHNKALNEQLSELPKLDTNSLGITKVSKWLKRDKIVNLKTASHKIFKNMDVAGKHVDKVSEKLTDVMDIATQIQDSLNLLGTTKRANLERELSTTNKNHVALEEMLMKTEKFIKDSKDYIDWFDQTVSDLKNKLAIDECKFVALNSKENAKWALFYIDDLEKFSAYGELDRWRMEEVAILSDKLKSVVQSISDYCK